MKKHKKTKDGTAYEKHTAHKMRLRGFFLVRRIGKSGDFGADIVARSWLFGRKIVVQCKNYSKPVGVRAVQEVIAARQFYKASRAAVATSNKFTRNARLLALRCGVELWEEY